MGLRPARGDEAGTVDEEDIRPAVVVVVEESDAAAHLLDQIPLVCESAGYVSCTAEACGAVMSVNFAASAGAPEESREMPGGRGVHSFLFSDIATPLLQIVRLPIQPGKLRHRLAALLLSA